MATALPSGSWRATPTAQDSERVFFTIVRNAAAARRFEVVEQRLETDKRLRRARLEGAAEQRFHSGISKLRQIGFAVGRTIKRKGIPDRGHRAQALRADDLIDEDKVILLHGREVDRLMEFL